MPRMTHIEMLQINEQPTLTIRTRTQVEKLPSLIGESYGKIAAYLQEHGECVSDVPFVAYHNMDMRDLDVEIGFPMAKVLPNRGEIKASSIPEGKVAFCMYRGAYSEMAPVYDEMAKWIADNGFKPAGSSYEYYYNSPEVPENELLTKIVIPFK